MATALRLRSGKLVINSLPELPNMPSDGFTSVEAFENWKQTADEIFSKHLNQLGITSERAVQARRFFYLATFVKAALITAKNEKLDFDMPDISLLRPTIKIGGRGTGLYEGEYNVAASIDFNATSKLTKERRLVRLYAAMFGYEDYGREVHLRLTENTTEQPIQVNKGYGNMNYEGDFSRDHIKHFYLDESIGDQPSLSQPTTPRQLTRLFSHHFAVKR